MASGQKPFYVIIGVVVVAGVAFIASRATRGPAISIPANPVVTMADTSGFRGYFLGAADAPVEVTEYGDLECIVCAGFAAVQFPDLKVRLIDPGKIRMRYRDYPLDGTHRHPRIAAHALACSNDQGHSWDVMDRMFATQNEWALVNDPMPGLTDIVKGAGANVDLWTECMKSAKYAGRIKASLDEGTALGVHSTPTLLIGGRLYTNPGSDEVVKVVDSIIAALPRKAPVPTKPTGGQ